MMLSMLISRPKKPGNDIDVYLEPLIDDLKKLWDKGIEAPILNGNIVENLTVATDKLTIIQHK